MLEVRLQNDGGASRLDSECVEDRAEGILNSKRRNKTAKRINPSCPMRDEADEALVLTGERFVGRVKIHRKDPHSLGKA
jgi:hypothetical protein